MPGLLLSPAEAARSGGGGHVVVVAARMAGLQRGNAQMQSSDFSSSLFSEPAATPGTANILAGISWGGFVLLLFAVFLVVYAGGGL